MAQSADVKIDAFLADEGFDTAGAAARAREVLEATSLTRPGKQAFTASKRERASRALEDTLARVCGDACLRLERAGQARVREAVVVTKASCEVCGGSNNAQAAQQAIAALRRRGERRIVIVGGSPGVRDGVERAFAGADVEIRFVDGTQRSHSARDADANKAWAQVIVVWGATELRHAVSDLYKTEVPEGVRVLTAPRRGVAALCQSLVGDGR